MKVYLLMREIYIRKPLSEVFSFFNRPENLAIITPKKLGFKIYTPTPIKMEKGTLIDYTIKILGFTFHWRTLITTYESPICFVDEQLTGPYAFWNHQHTFSEYNEGTLMKDMVHYALPLGYIGILAHEFFVKKQINYIFDYRTKIINDLFSK
jgi:ligand-binding SRPBCC domain-containing protein